MATVMETSDALPSSNDGIGWFSNSETFSEIIQTQYTVSPGDIFRGAVDFHFNQDGNEWISDADAVKIFLVEGQSVIFEVLPFGDTPVSDPDLYIFSGNIETFTPGADDSSHPGVLAIDDRLGLPFIDFTAEYTGYHYILLEDFDTRPAQEQAGYELSISTSPSRIDGTVNSEALIGGASEDVILGYDGNDTLQGAGADDVLVGGGGDDTLDGGDGNDTAFFSGASNRYTVSLGSELLIFDRANEDASDQLISIESLSFSDEVIDFRSFDDAAALSATEFAELAELYTAYFGRAPDAMGLMFWADARANGTPIEEIARHFANSPEAQRLFPDNTAVSEFVSVVYSNVLGRIPDNAGFEFWVNSLESGDIDQGTFVMSVLNGVESGADSIDRAYLDKKNAISLYFSAVLGMSTGGLEVMELYDGTEESVAEAFARADTVHQESSNLDGSGQFLIQYANAFGDLF